MPRSLASQSCTGWALCVQVSGAKLPILCVSSTATATLTRQPCVRGSAAEGISLTKPHWSSQLDRRLSAPSISKADSDFLQLGLEFVEGREGIVTSDLNALFEKVRGNMLVHKRPI